jgi:hypothetical protein
MRYAIQTEAQNTASVMRTNAMARSRWCTHLR